MTLIAYDINPNHPPNLSKITKKIIIRGNYILFANVKPLLKQ